MSGKNLKILLFLLLLIGSNIYLLKPGFWFAQDTSYWPKNSYESITMLSQQLNVFINFGYYIGFDQGLFNFTRIAVVGLITLLSYLFGYSHSQSVFSIIGYTISFISFYLFSGIIFANKNTRYVLSLLYAFHPLTHTLQGYAMYNSAIPLFLYSFKNYFNNSHRINFFSLIVNIFSAFIWIAYIRFFQSNFFIVIPYIAYLAMAHKINLSVKKSLIFLSTYLLIFSPIIYNLIIQLTEKSQTAFHYGTILGKFIPDVQFINSFSLMQSIGVDLYKNPAWAIIGTSFFAILIAFLIVRRNKKNLGIIYLNLIIVLIAITLYGLSNIFGDTIYLQVIKFFPFIINAPFFAVYIQYLPFIILAGLLLENRKKVLYCFVFIYIIFSIAPLLNIKSKNFNNFQISNIPKPYDDYFVKPYYGIPESTYYFIDSCWRATYMEKVSDENICLNFGLRYASATLSDPRLVSSDEYNLASILKNQVNLSNLRVTHNLKNIILPVDLTNKEEIMLAKSAKIAFDSNPILTAKNDKNFIHYQYKDHTLYDFFIYSPKSKINKNDLFSISDNLLKIQESPVVLNSSASEIANMESIRIDYKISPLNPNVYLLRLREINKHKQFIVQFNQKYQYTWKLKVVEKDFYEHYKCISRWEEFRYTNNYRCIYNYSFFDLNNILLFQKPQMENAQHIKSNYINNGWIIKPINNLDIYVVLVNEKQIYYNIAIFISFSTMGLLLLAGIISKIKYEKK